MKHEDSLYVILFGLIGSAIVVVVGFFYVVVNVM